MAAPSQPADADIIELEPTREIRLDGAPPRTAAARDAGAVGFAREGLTLGGETHTLRRERLKAAAFLLAVAFGVFFVWIVATFKIDRAEVAVLFGLRAVLSAGIAAVLASKMEIGRSSLRGLEVGLFGGLMILLCISQYLIGMDLARREDLAGLVAYSKNGVIQAIVLMFLYATLLPNDTLTAARATFLMALAPVFVSVLLIEHPEVAHLLQGLRNTEHFGSNALVLLVGAGMATYAARILHHLRSELHEARRLGQYQLVRRLGAGGMGEVYLAEHQLLKRPCAVKLIRPEAGADALARARFEREVQAASQIGHPNTVEIYDYGVTEDGTFYYVMEYLAGLGLDELLRDFGPLPAGRVIYLLRQACAGLARAHALGLVHRDLKPANIFVAVKGGEADVVKILDFGLVKLTRPGSTELTTDQTVSGTPLFMAPEQAIGDRDLDERADIYALGAIAYLALTGRTPFDGKTAFEIMMAHARDAVAPPSRFNPDIPADLERIVIRCLTKRPDERPTDCASLGRMLGECESAKEWDPYLAEMWWTATFEPIALDEAPAEAAQV